MPRNMPPKSATLAASFGPVVADDGREITAQLWRGRASDGYKSDFERRQAEWVVLTANGRTVLATRFAGRNLPNARREYDAAVTTMREHATR